VANQSSISERFNRLPRAIHWLIFAVAFILLFQAWFSFVRPVVDRCNEAADEIQAQVAAVREGSELARRLRRMDDAVRAIGPVMQPGDENEASQALTQAYVEVMSKYSVSNDSFDLRGGEERVSELLSRQLVRSGGQLRRLTAELAFEAKPADAMAIIADFEQRPDIEAVSKVNLLRIAGRKLKVKLTIEAWAEVAKSD
jgi:hypothetical protein